MNSQHITFDVGRPLVSNEKRDRFRPRRIRNGVWTGLLSSIVLLAASNTSFAQSALSDDADTQSGQTSNLTLNAGSNVYLKFKITPTLPANTPGASVSKATIKLYLGSVRSSGTVDVYQLSSDWSEQTIASAPPILGNQLQAGIPIHLDQQGKFLVIDITAVAQLWLGTDGSGTGGAPNHGVVLI